MSLSLIAMEVFRHLADVRLGHSACAIGMFDGVHLGHRMVLEQALRTAKINSLASVVMTFDNHPQSIVSQTPTPLLSTTGERLAAFAAMGFDAALVLDFTPDIKELTADAFIETILIDTLRIRAVSIGYDHRFGRDRLGNGAYLEQYGETHGFETFIIDPVRADDQIISSTLIRKLLSYGDLMHANRLLGQPYRLTGSVITGVGRGRAIGFPTANLAIPAGRLMPAVGVYAGEVDIPDTGETGLPAVCNIGHAPTFGDQPQARMEVHLLDHSADLYGKTLTFRFRHHLRAEQAFTTVEALMGQIAHDCQNARILLAVAPDASA